MEINVLASSSEGNCTAITVEDKTILIDAGISMRKTFNLLGSKNIDAIFLSHEHGDHTMGAGPLGRKLGIPIYAHPLIIAKLKKRLKNCNLKAHDPGEIIKLGKIEIKSFSTKHDSIYSYGYIINDLLNNKRFGYMTDTGSWTPLMLFNLKNCDGYLFEADYDEEALEKYEEYDQFLKDRIRSNYGHLSIAQVIELIKELDLNNVPIIFGHLSPRTNSPELVKKATDTNLSDWNKDNFYIAPTIIKIE